MPAISLCGFWRRRASWGFSFRSSGRNGVTTELTHVGALGGGAGLAVVVGPIGSSPSSSGALAASGHLPLSSHCSHSHVNRGMRRVLVPGAAFNASAHP